jgi:hypothetical protein
VKSWVPMQISLKVMIDTFCILNNLIQQHIGLECAGFIRFQLIPVEDKKVLLIECQPYPSAAFLKIGKNEEFYLRIGPGSRRLSTSEVLAYMQNRKLEPS